jgi:hypothetical protein
MDSVHLSDSICVLDGLCNMMTVAVGPHEYVQSYVDVPVALLLVEVAKRADDRAEWFPRGKWATIQAMQGEVERQMRGLFVVTPNVELTGAGTASELNAKLGATGSGEDEK